jgi:hypothetical protein
VIARLIWHAGVSSGRSGLRGKAQIAKTVNATAIPLERAVQGYTDFDKGAAKKFVLDPHGMLATRA